MKKYFLLIFLFCISNIFAQDWKVLMEPEIKASLNDIYMVSETEGWAVGNTGLIYHTTDGFATFDVQTSNVASTINLMKVYFINKNVGWIGTSKGTLLKTTNGGVNWTVNDFSTVKPTSFGFTTFETMYFVDANLGFWIAGKSKNEFIFKTTDGGLTWAVKDSLVGTTAKYWTDIRFYNANKGVVVGDVKGIQKYTTDGGNTWAFGDSTVYSPFKISTVRYTDENTLICLGEGNEFWSTLLPIYKSTDGGKTWKNITPTTPAVYDRIKDIYFKDSQNGLAVGNNGFTKMFIYKTSDGGNTWTASEGNFSTGFQALEGYGNTVFAIGGSGHILKSTDFGSTWVELKLRPPAQITGITFNGPNGYAINVNGDLFYSSDNGNTWKFKSTTGRWNAGTVKFVSNSTGFALKENRHILKTTDYGTTWNTVLDPVTYASYNKVGGLFMVNQNVGYAWMSISAYANYYMYKTTDGGATWTQVYNDAAGAGYLSGNIVFFDENTGVMAGPKYKVNNVYTYWLKRTTDGGATWTVPTVSGKPSQFSVESFNDVAYIDANKAIAIAVKTMFMTTDKGATWQYVTHGVTGIDTSFSSVSFSGQKGVVLLSGGGILITTDGGSTWTKNTDGVGKSLYKATLNGNGVPVFGTSTGYVYSYGAVTDVKYEGNNSLITDYSLDQNYPNPFNPTTIISYSVPKESKVKLEVFDVLGRLVTTLVDQVQIAGKYKVDFKAPAFSSGVYFYRLTTPNQSFSKKMLFIK